ncbi:MAG: prepilin-type N-terminal cleavage/methylation domain-containing protein [Candidatus Harrisonbacteria bacterium]|nr:prepilin-type N-terminal cleavage/methylation domain-containing protein [Candidatus Harrisonbacteria bacterium]
MPFRIFALFRTSVSTAATRGVTLMEVIVTVAIAGILLGIGAPLTWDFYLRNELRAQQSGMIAYLRTARTRAFSNRNQSAHGVFVGANNITIFEGPSYAARNMSRDEVFPRPPGIAAIGTTEFVFAALSGRTASSTITFQSSVDTAHVGVNSEGLVE